ncbi:MAG: thioredoxin-like protein [Monoraphidium minutum]|nr:MAG: thioredoxin-like protein [Monoraphidium minutum]
MAPKRASKKAPKEAEPAPLEAEEEVGETKAPVEEAAEEVAATAAAKPAAKGRKRAPAAKKGPAPPAAKRGRAAAKPAAAAAASESESEEEAEEEEASAEEEPAPKAKGKAKAEPKAKAKPAAAAGGGAKGGKLSAGGAFPEVELETEAGEKFASSEVLAEGGLVIFAYPKANTGGCTKQALGFKEAHEEFAAAGYKVFGISADNPKPQANWKAKLSLPYSLLCDTTRDALKALGILQARCCAGGKIVRSHIVVAKGGKIVDVRYGISPGDSPKEALASTK